MILYVHNKMMHVANGCNTSTHVYVLLDIAKYE